MLSVSSRIWTRVAVSISYDYNHYTPFYFRYNFDDFQECCVQSWTSPGGNTLQDTNCTATCLLSWKLFKLDEPDMQDTAGEAGTDS